MQVCHTACLPIYSQLHTPSKERMGTVNASSVSLAFLIYVATGVSAPPATDSIPRRLKAGEPESSGAMNCIQPLTLHRITSHPFDIAPL